jgi:hypothetical protein
MCAPNKPNSKELLSFNGSHYLCKTNNLACRSNIIKYYNTYIKNFLSSTNEFSQKTNQIKLNKIF